jgi:hypothetical protein
MLDAVFYGSTRLPSQGQYLFQDNKSAILLEKNGKASSSKRTKHISIRYFFITDRVKKGDVSLAWCPTGDMIGDYVTKPLQGALFRQFRDQIIGVVPERDPGPGKVKPGDSILRIRKVKPISVTAKKFGSQTGSWILTRSRPRSRLSKASSALVRVLFRRAWNHRSVL